MERDDVSLSFRHGKRRVVTDDNPIRADEARESLETIEKMRSASHRRAAPPRAYSLGIALIVTIGFALYAQNDPGDFPGIFIALGVALFAASSRNKMGAMSKAVPDTRTGVWALIGVSAFLFALFFGGIYLRRAFDLAWLPIVTGLIAGATIYFIAEHD
jgi:hypothetical protein